MLCLESFAQAEAAAEAEYRQTQCRLQAREECLTLREEAAQAQARIGELERRLVEECRQKGEVQQQNIVVRGQEGHLVQLGSAVASEITVKQQTLWH